MDDVGVGDWISPHVAAQGSTLDPASSRETACHHISSASGFPKSVAPAPLGHNRKFDRYTVAISR